MCKVRNLIDLVFMMRLVVFMVAGCCGWLVVQILFSFHLDTIAFLLKSLPDDTSTIIIFKFPHGDGDGRYHLACGLLDITV